MVRLGGGMDIRWNFLLRKSEPPRTSRDAAHWRVAVGFVGRFLESAAWLIFLCPWTPTATRAPGSPSAVLAGAAPGLARFPAGAFQEA